MSMAYSKFLVVLPFHIPLSFLLLLLFTAATATAGAVEAPAATGHPPGPATPGQAFRLGMCNQAAGCHQVPAGDPEGGGSADETEERTAAAAGPSHSHPAQQDPEPSCKFHPSKP